MCHQGPRPKDRNTFFVPTQEDICLTHGLGAGSSQGSAGNVFQHRDSTRKNSAAQQEGSRDGDTAETPPAAAPATPPAAAAAAAAGAANTSAIDCIGKKRKSRKNSADGSESPHTICSRLDLGADPNAQNIFGDTRLHCAKTADMVRVMIEGGADMDAQNGMWRTPLHCAVAQDRVAVCQALVDFGASLTLRDNQGKSALDYACLYHHDALVRILATHERANPSDTDETGLTALHWAHGKTAVDTLVDAGSDVNTQDRRERSPLHYLYAKNNITICALLNRGANINATDAQLQTPLHLATKRKDDPDLVRFMILRGANIGARDIRGKTPLHMAAQRGRVAVTRILMAKGQDPNLQSLKGMSAITLAAANGHLCTVNAIMFSGRNVLLNARDELGQTPLHYTARKKYVAVTVKLLRAEADPNIRSNNGMSPIDIAVIEGQQKTLEAMIQHGADVTDADNIGQTPLHHAAQHGNAEAAGTLINAGADPVARNSQDLSPLDIATTNGKLEVVITLIRHSDKVDVNAADQQGWTALHYATRAANVAITETLMDAGADHGIRNSNQASPFDHAVGYGQHSTVKLMVQRGASVTAADDMGFTALHLAENENMIDILVAEGAVIDAQNHEGNTPFMYQSVDPQLVRTHLRHGAKINIRNEQGKTVLHMVATSCTGNTMVTIVDDLLKAGADETIRDNDGHTPHYYYSADTSPAAAQAARLLRNASADRAWRRRGNLLMCMQMQTPFVTPSTEKSLFMSLSDTKKTTEGIFRNIVSYL